MLSFLKEKLTVTVPKNLVPDKKLWSVVNKINEEGTVIQYMTVERVIEGKKKEGMQVEDKDRGEM